MDIRGHISHLLRAALLAGVVLGALWAAPASALLGSGPKWLTQSQLTGTGPVSGVQVATDSQGDALAVWIDGAGAVDFSYRAAGGGNTFSSPAGITGSGVAPSNLHLAMDRAGDAVAVWDENGNTVWAAPFSLSNTSSFGTLVNVAGTVANPATSPDVAIYNENGSGFAPNAEIVWIDNDSGAHHILQGRYFDLSGTLGAVQPLTNDSEPDVANPQVVLDSAGNAIAAWQQSDGTNVLIESEVKPGGPSGGFGGPSFRTARSSDGTDAADVRLGGDNADGTLPNAGGVTVVWDDSGGAVDAAYMPLGNTNWNPTQTEVGAGTLPAVAIDGLGNAYAVWQTSGGLIDAAALEAGAVPPQQFGASQQLSANGHASANAQIGSETNNETIAVWQDTTVGQIDGAVQTTPQFPVSFGAAAEVNSTSGGSPASPSVAVASTGDAVAGWQQAAQAQMAGYDNGPQFHHVQIPNAPYAGHPVTFSAHVTDVWSTLPGSGSAWTFGDGGNGTGNPVTHTYTSTGVLSPATLAVTDLAGVQGPVQSGPVTVGTQPAAVPGGLFQLDSPNDCVTGWTWGCGTLLSGDPTNADSQTAVSPDGKNVYLVDSVRQCE